MDGNTTERRHFDPLTTRFYREGDAFEWALQFYLRDSRWSELAAERGVEPLTCPRCGAEPDVELSGLAYTVACPDCYDLGDPVASSTCKLDALAEWCAEIDEIDHETARKVAVELDDDDVQDDVLQAARDNHGDTIAEMAARVEGWRENLDPY